MLRSVGGLCQRAGSNLFFLRRIYSAQRLRRLPKTVIWSINNPRDTRKYTSHPPGFDWRPTNLAIGLLLASWGFLLSCFPGFDDGSDMSILMSRRGLRERQSLAAKRPLHLDLCKRRGLSRHFSTVLFLGFLLRTGSHRDRRADV